MSIVRRSRGGIASDRAIALLFHGAPCGAPKAAERRLTGRPEAPNVATAVTVASFKSDQSGDSVLVVRSVVVAWRSASGASTCGCMVLCGRRSDRVRLVDRESVVHGQRRKRLQAPFEAPQCE